MSSQSPESSNITLRPVTPDDNDFLMEVYGSTRADELALTPWTGEQRAAFIHHQFTAQQTHYAQNYPSANHDIILFNGRQVGRLYVGRLDREIRIVDITVLPAERNAGIGSYLIRELLNEAERTKRSLRIWVEEFNPALNLFERLGFSRSEQQGMHILMEWTTGDKTQ
jgi:ribosomal protein S18 acetylase RimI-like enzyme